MARLVQRKINKQRIKERRPSWAASAYYVSHLNKSIVKNKYGYQNSKTHLQRTIKFIPIFDYIKPQAKSKYIKIK